MWNASSERVHSLIEYILREIKNLHLLFIISFLKAAKSQSSECYSRWKSAEHSIWQGTWHLAHSSLVFLPQCAQRCLVGPLVRWWSRPSVRMSAGTLLSSGAGHPDKGLPICLDDTIILMYTLTICRLKASRSIGCCCWAGDNLYKSHPFCTETSTAKAKKGHYHF